MVKLSSLGHGQNDAEPHSSAVHLFVAFGHLIKWILLNHRMNTAERAEFQGVLRILRRARMPTGHRLRFVISEKTLIESGSSVCLITLIFRFIPSTCAIIDAIAGRLRGNDIISNSVRPTRLPASSASPRFL